MQLAQDLFRINVYDLQNEILFCSLPSCIEDLVRFVFLRTI
jgi:hypothetical protein